ncbi:MAG: hypothetical protein IJT08_01175 [Alphaproteobacteria bacterium]|nr:hypothetical protein [Alphaproteobacteria bacterium]
MKSNLELPLCVVHRMQGRSPQLTVICYCFFPKRGEEKVLICRAAVKLVGRSPKSKR